MTARTNDPYIVKSLVHASKILEAFDPPGDVLRLRDIVERTGYGKGCASGCCTPSTSAASSTRSTNGTIAW
jgi:hypothetical protein